MVVEKHPPYRTTYKKLPRGEPVRGVIQAPTPDVCLQVVAPVYYSSLIKTLPMLNPVHGVQGVGRVCIDGPSLPRCRRWFDEKKFPVTVTEYTQKLAMDIDTILGDISEEYQIELSGAPEGWTASGQSACACRDCLYSYMTDNPRKLTPLRCPEEHPVHFMCAFNNEDDEIICPHCAEHFD